MCHPITIGARFCLRGSRQTPFTVIPPTPREARVLPLRRAACRREVSSGSRRLAETFHVVPPLAGAVSQPASLIECGSFYQSDHELGFITLSFPVVGEPGIRHFSSAESCIGGSVRCGACSPGGLTIPAARRAGDIGFRERLHGTHSLSSNPHPAAVVLEARCEVQLVLHT